MQEEPDGMLPGRRVFWEARMYGIQRRAPCPGCVPCRLAAKKIVQVLKAAASISFHTVTDMTRYDSYFWI